MFLLMVHFPVGYKSQFWARIEPLVIRSESPTCVEETQVLGPFSTPFPDTLSGI